MPGSRKQQTVGVVADALDALAPLALAQSWDNVGLLAGDRSASCRGVLLCIDLTAAVLAEAARGRCDLVVAYHPPIFRPISRLLADSGGTDAVVHAAIAVGIGIYSPHTALDAAPGGTNDVLAGLCGLSDLQPFEYVSTGPAQSKLVTFVPEAEVERVAAALFAAGAGRIGDYEQCSYRVRGEGTFFGREGTDPKVGRAGRLEHVPEIRMEAIVPDRVLPEVVAALRRSHPYEEPAFDAYRLAGEPAAGIGRVGRLPAGTTLAALAKKLQAATRSQVLTTVGPARRMVRRAAVCAGSAGRLPLERPRSADCDVIVTGEIRHHDALEFLRRQVCAVAVGHWESERPVLGVLARRLGERLPGLRCLVSRRDTPPFNRA